MNDGVRLRSALNRATDALLAELNDAGHWNGELSSSALSTATAVIALDALNRNTYARHVAFGLKWLASHSNADGGWGDTTASKSNISTTALCWAAFGKCEADDRYPEIVKSAEAWLRLECGASMEEGGSLGTPERSDLKWRTALLPNAIAARYGKDRTFSVPILMTLALSGRLGPAGWTLVPGLPFELAAISHRFWGALRLPVVSYALPALIAIGQAIHHHAPTRNPLLRILRTRARAKTLRVLETLQPANGGFLEATPLTSFVTMSLATMGPSSHCVALKGAEFLVASVRPDGSWPIDTNLATWTTTLAVKALAHQPGSLNLGQCATLRAWLLAQQWVGEHPYTHAAPGGWAWTDLPGGVPDADDTPGALLAIKLLGLTDATTHVAAISGCRWLLGLQNRDGGIPTFCRGWGALPFDRSSQDLTAHTLRAWIAWRSETPPEHRSALTRAIHRGLGYLIRTQRPDGSWLPLWFGNENAPNDENPVYGTAMVVCALRELLASGCMPAMAPLAMGSEWIAREQNEDGGWGGTRGTSSSIEETALAIEALAGTSHVQAVNRGTEWLVEKVESGEWRRPAPIGFYFARLWYHERLYPLIWTVGALGRVMRECPQE